MALSKNDKWAIFWIVSGMFQIYGFISSLILTNTKHPRIQIARRVLYGLGIFFNFGAAYESHRRDVRPTPETILPLSVGVEVENEGDGTRKVVCN